MSISYSVFKPYVQNYHTNGTGRDTYIFVNDQRLIMASENTNCNWKVAQPNFYHDGAGSTMMHTAP